MTKECKSCGASNADSMAVCGNCRASLSAAPSTPQTPVKERDPREERWSRVLPSSSVSEPRNEPRRSVFSHDGNRERDSDLGRIAEAIERNATATERIFLLLLILTLIGLFAGLIAAIVGAIVL